MIEVLHILYGGDPVGLLEYDRRTDRVSLLYEKDWQFDGKGFPVSLSLPLEKRTHAGEKVSSFLQGLLPDNPAILESWAKRFQVSPRNPFDVIRHVGEDCAGGLQFVQPARLGPVLSGALDKLTELSDGDLVKRMADLKAQSRAIPTRTEGRFSLAGAQSKDALHLADGKWCVAEGRIPSTHILKPQSGEWNEHVLNECFCLDLASRIPLPAAKTEVLEIGGERTLCVRRYDRTRNPETGELIRWHQEDTCQALGFHPRQKYQADGGPSASDIVKLLRKHSSDPEEDIDRFVGALAFNWIICGTDGHSKNYSLIHGPGSFLRLAPLYDIASFLPYEADLKSTRLKLAMKIGGSYRFNRIGKDDWIKWGQQTGLGGDRVVARVEVVAEKVEEMLAEGRDGLAADDSGGFVESLRQRILDRVRQCEMALRTGSGDA